MRKLNYDNKILPAEDTYEEVTQRFPNLVGKGPFRCVNPIRKGLPRKNEFCEHMNRFVFEHDPVQFSESNLKIQLQFWMSKKPTELIYSGNKSYHAIFEVSDWDTLDKDYYKSVYESLKVQFEKELELELDKAMCNPARLTRTPGVMRKDTRKMQELVYQGCSYSKAELSKFGANFFKPIKKADHIWDKKQLPKNYKLKEKYKDIIDGNAKKGTRHNAICELAGCLKVRGDSIANYETQLLSSYPDMKVEIQNIVRDFG